ncbi:ABC transporter permease [Halalkalibacter sp. APA_J-10(15)]|uniref:ABC transporter permease n=1 Tax=Halalkalibacter sp. APA_J-10(15) TaxID=2933805 RepID=UPI001FF6ECA4|nr:ABC transporter permease [Halalkalibacter sp. APA_J-10(15)]MCK0469920.1 ABC transporter permease [Halalkalibacter sp. APA_J-10(15)]
MSINHLITQNIKKNLGHYFLYIFALVFSVALYFSFVTLQYDPAMDPAKGSIRGGAAIQAASVLLVAIVLVFLVYANTIFLKRRSSEIALYRLIGMNKGEVFRIITFENAVLYIGSLLIGAFLGFASSKLIAMILFQVTGVDDIASLTFSPEAFIQTIIVFSCIFLLLMVMNNLFIKKQSILALFQVRSTSEHKIKKYSIIEIIIGVLGIGLIIAGYYVSSILFDGSLTDMIELVVTMLFILASVIIGTYLFYKGSVSFIFQCIRKRKNGYLSIHHVLSLSSIMFRMKSNALLLTIITTVSALAIGLLSLSYISYYSAEKTAEQYVAADFSFTDQEAALSFQEALEENDVSYERIDRKTYQADFNIEDILDANLEGLNFDPNTMRLSVISDTSLHGYDLEPDEVIFSGYSSILQSFLSLKDSGSISLQLNGEEQPLTYLGLDDGHHLSLPFTNGGLPIAIVDEARFSDIEMNHDEDIQLDYSEFVGFLINNNRDLESANEWFHKLELSESSGSLSKTDTASTQKQNMGLIMFMVGFLGLTFLVTSGCILYFKQVDECEGEKGTYTILRKLGFTESNLLRGIQRKQLLNFGIPLTVGLSHSYFAVQSGWFIFGTELWTPMLLVMTLYTILYSLFGILSVLHYKKVIRAAL